MERTGPLCPWRLLGLAVLKFRQGQPSNCFCHSKFPSVRTLSCSLSWRVTEESSPALSLQCRRGQGHQHGPAGVADRTGCEATGPWAVGQMTHRSEATSDLALRADPPAGGSHVAIWMSWEPCLRPKTDYERRAGSSQLPLSRRPRRWPALLSRNTPSTFHSR